MQWHLSNPITISTSLPKKLRGTNGWVHHSELNNASSKAVAVLGQSSEIVPLLICQNTPFAETYPHSSNPILPGEVKQLITNKKIHKELQHEGEKLGCAAQKTKAGYKEKLGHKSIMVSLNMLPQPCLSLGRMPLLPHTPARHLCLHKTEEMAQAQRHKTTKDQLIS